MIDGLNLCYREGQLYRADLAFITRVHLSVPLSGLDTASQLGQFARLRLEAEFVDGSEVFSEEGAYVPTTEGLRALFPSGTEYLRRCCVGASVWQRKEFAR